VNHLHRRAAKFELELPTEDDEVQHYIVVLLLKYHNSIVSD
jgi:hypothetical protein